MTKLMKEIVGVIREVINGLTKVSWKIGHSKDVKRDEVDGEIEILTAVADKIESQDEAKKVRIVKKKKGGKA